jgi:MoaA/NifB/PqqE/SkfB family radical SAM enzyme
MSLIKQGLNFALFSFGKNKPITGPIRVHWDITELCNSRCRHCTRWKIKNAKEDLTYEECTKFIDELRETGTKAISFAGNEPLMRKDIYKIIEYANKKGFSLSLNSNGLLMNEKNCSTLVNSGVTSFIFSLDSCYKEKYDSIRGIPGAFEKILEAVKNLRNIKEKTGKKITIQATIVVNKENIEDLEKTADLCKKIGFDKIVLQPIHNIPVYFESEKKLMPQKEDLKKMAEQLEAIIKKYPSFIGVPKEYLRNFRTFLENPNALYKYRCEAGFITCDIRANGDVVPCPVGFVKMGNLKENSFKEIWFSEQSNKIRTGIKANKHPMCWFACVQPINLMAYNLSHMKLRNIFDKEFLKHAFSKLK